jgi:hypothetical protein
MIELMDTSAKSTFANDMLPDIDIAEYNASKQDMYSSLASLRARGITPLAVSMVSEHEIANFQGTYDIHIAGITPKKVGATYSRVWGYTPSVYDVGLGLFKTAKEIFERDAMNEFIEKSLKPRLYNADDMKRIATYYFANEIGEGANKIATGEAARTEHSSGVVERILEDKFGLKKFSPENVGFGAEFTHPSIDAEYYIHNDAAKAFSRTIQEFQLPAKGIIDRGTRIFRFSILGLSPRYTAHIALGGTFMVLLRTNPFNLLHYGAPAIHFALHGSFSKETLEKFPHISEVDYGGATEEGLADMRYHYIMMNTAGRHWLIPEWLSRNNMVDNNLNRIKAAGELNMRFTRAIVRLQKGAVYLDAAERASKAGTMYYADELVPRSAVNPEHAKELQVDEQGRPVYHPQTARLIHDTVRSKHPMTPEQTHAIGMQTVSEVMGDLRHMTPLERTILTKIFPFYGWTKHVLRYVMSYPFDHPYRAQIIANIAEQSSQDTASGLPLRIQLLTMLGQPDAYGNVTAIDTKALNPFRDTANYASLTGLFESLNPAITGFGALVDPQISFAGQNAYPTITFNSVYGISSAGAGGNIYNAAEQFVPQISGLDQAFNLSGQYAYLKSSSPQEFSKKIFESFGLPFTPEQLNLRQIAAQQEADRYKQAAQAGYEAATNPSSNALAGYPANAQIPDPLNTEYNVTPAYIAAMNQQSEKETGLPFYATQAPPPNQRL